MSVFNPIYIHSAFDNSENAILTVYFAAGVVASSVDVTRNSDNSLPDNLGIKYAVGTKRPTRQVPVNERSNIKYKDANSEIVLLRTEVHKEDNFLDSTLNKFIINAARKNLSNDKIDFINKTDHGATNISRKREINEIFSTLQFDLYGDPENGFYTVLEIGTPPQKMNFLIDTASNNIAVACYPEANALNHFSPDNSSTFLSEYLIAYVTYSQGIWMGYLAHDMVTFRDIYNNTYQFELQFACMTKSINLFQPNLNWSGIIGLAKRDVVQPDTINTRSFLESLMIFWGQFIRPNFVINIFESVLNEQPGSHHVTGKMLITPHTQISNCNISTNFDAEMSNKWFYNILLYGIHLNEIPFMEDCQFLNLYDILIDTGTTDIKMPIAIFQKFKKYMQDEYIKKYKLLQIDVHNAAMKTRCQIICHNFSPAGDLDFDRGRDNFRKNFPELVFEIISTIDNSTFNLKVWPWNYLITVDLDLNEELRYMVHSHFYPTLPTSKLAKTQCYKMAISESSSDNFIIGSVALRGISIAFNQTSKTMAFGEDRITCIHEESNYDIKRFGKPKKLTGPFSYNKDIRRYCSSNKRFSSRQTLITTAYILATFLMILFLTAMATSQCRTKNRLKLF
ncbi:unnamed protein product [Gordionus sp. m RMFG-2023]